MTRFRKRSMFARLLLYTTLSLSLFILLISFLLYATFEKKLISSVSKTSVQLLQQTSYSADYMNDSARNFALSVFNDPNTVELMYNAEKPDMSALVLEMNRMQTFAGMNSFVHSMYIYNRKTGQFYSFSQTLEDDADDFFDKPVTEMMRQPEPALRLKPILRTLEHGDPTGRDIDVFTYVIYENYSAGQGVDGAVIVNIRGEYLQNLISAFHSGNALMQGDTFILGREGEPILDSLGRTHESSGMTAVIDGMNGRNDRSGFFTATVSGEKSLVTYVKSDSLQWTFVHAAPYGAIVKDAEKVRITTILIGLGLLAAGLLISYLISSRIYSPIRRLTLRAGRLADLSGGGASEELNELDVLDRAVAEAYKLNRTTSEEKRNRLLTELLRDGGGTRSDESLVGTLARHGILLEEGYRIVALRLDRCDRFRDRYGRKDQELLLYSIGNAAAELLSAHGRTQIADFGDGTLAAIVQAKHGLDGEEKLRELLDVAEEIQTWSQSQLKLGLTAAIGDRRERAGQLNEAYAEAVHLLGYRLVYGHGARLTTELLLSRKQAGEAAYRMTPAEEQELHDELTNGRLDEAMNVYRAIIARVSGYAYDVLMSNIHYLLYFAHNTMNVMANNSIDKHQVPFHDSLEQLPRLETLDDVEAVFAGMFARITDAVATRKIGRSSALADTIQSFVRKRYADSGLCLEMVAEEMKMSKVYLGKVYREAYGHSVADYIVEVRIAKAIELLKEDNKSLSRILDEIGVENKKYFYTLFKKKMGVPFSDYRLKHVNGAGGGADGA